MELYIQLQSYNSIIMMWSIYKHVLKCLHFPKAIYGVLYYFSEYEGQYEKEVPSVRNLPDVSNSWGKGFPNCTAGFWYSDDERNERDIHIWLQGG